MDYDRRIRKHEKTATFERSIVMVEHKSRVLTLLKIDIPALIILFVLWKERVLLFKTLTGTLVILELLLLKPHFWNMVYIRNIKFCDTFVPGEFLIWCIENELFRKKRNFRTIFESITSPTILKLEQLFFFYCVKNLLLYKSYGIHLAILGLFLFCLYIFWNSHLFSKSTHISQNIPES